MSNNHKIIGHWFSKKKLQKPLSLEGIEHQPTQCRKTCFWYINLLCIISRGALALRCGPARPGPACGSAAGARVGRVAGGSRFAGRGATPSDPRHPARPAHLLNARPGPDICQDQDFKYFLVAIYANPFIVNVYIFGKSAYI